VADLTGLSLNAISSDGDNFYGNYDQVNRFGVIPWQAYSVVHLEFSPLDNLARYGWDKYIGSGGKSAEGLGWPLHAIGDACEPHHVIASSSWGHKPYENAVEDFFDDFFPTVDADRIAKENRILTASYQWWLQLQTDPDVGRFIEALAQATVTKAMVDGEWAYQDQYSLLWMQGLGILAEVGYRGQPNESRMIDLVEMSSAATVAFLTFAGQQAHDAGMGNKQCASGTEFKINQGCIAALPPSMCALGTTACVTPNDCPNSVDYTCTNHCCLVVLE
jgi:hypothetical protein